MAPITPTTSSDAALLRGDAAAFATFYRRHEDVVLRYHLRRVRRADAAADLAAETFAAALAGRRTLDPARGAARRWLFGIARHVLARSLERGRVEDETRRRLRMEPVIVDDQALGRIDALSEQMALAALADLPDDQRVAVHGRVLDGAEYAELATRPPLALAGGAVAALDLLPTGDSVPEAVGPDVLPTVDDSERVLRVRAADPEGGPAWGIWTFRQRITGGREIECFVAARVQDDRIGVVGRDGAFGDDGRFHPLQTRSSAGKRCGSISKDGTRFAGGDGPPVPASGSSGSPGPPVGGCRENVPSSTMSPQTRRRLRDVPRCDRRGQRIVKCGFAGPEAVRITYGNTRWSRTIRPISGDSGAYIFVLRPRDAAGGGPLTLKTTHSDGTVCFQARYSPPSGPGCTPPPGIPSARERR